MASTTVVRCPGCGYDSNNPYFRYCGICGTPLKQKEAPAPRQVAPARPPSSKKPSLTINSFSILGLQDDAVLEDSGPEDFSEEEPGTDELTYRPELRRPESRSRRSAEYLLEDEELESSHTRLYLSLALLAICAGVLAWQWQAQGSPLAFMSSAFGPEKRSLSTQPVLPAADNSQTTASTPVIPAPADSAAASPKVEIPTSPAVPEAQPAPPAGSKTPDVTPQPSQSASEAAEPAPLPEQHRPAPAAGVLPAVAPDPKPVASRPSESQTLAPVPAPADADQLFAEGQKYLYGDGVAKDCGRALQDLRESARTNSEAASLLGTMYASGHCVGRNLAPAYHWYARALHHDPTNARFKSDLTVLWNQMSPAEKQAAMRIAP